MKIVELPSIASGTPARVNRNTGTIYLNKSVFDKFPELYKKFVIYHEECHYIFQTKDEEMCDEFAMYKLLTQGYKPKEIVEALLDTLSNNSAHYARKINLVNNMRIYDYLANNNNKTLTPL